MKSRYLELAAAWERLASEDDRDENSSKTKKERPHAAWGRGGLMQIDEGTSAES
jgi:hypothetical protein